MANDQLSDIRRAIEGLLYPSESDEPFDVVDWGGGGPTSAREQIAAHVPADRNIELVPVDHFFEQLRDSDDAERFSQLRDVLQSSLSGLQVFRASSGTARVDLFLIGQTASGEWAGLHTVSIET